MLSEHAADRLDTAEAVPVLVDERYERVSGRSSSAAKKLATAFKISFARFSSVISFFIALTCAGSSVVVPSRAPLSIWSRRIHLRSVSVVPIPSLAATALIADHSCRTEAALRRPCRLLVCTAQGGKRKGVP